MSSFSISFGGTCVIYWTVDYSLQNDSRKNDFLHVLLNQKMNDRFSGFAVEKMSILFVTCMGVRVTPGSVDPVESEMTSLIIYVYI